MSLRSTFVTTALLAALATASTAAELKSLIGGEPLRSDFNKDKGSVRIVFLGAPT